MDYLTPEMIAGIIGIVITIVCSICLCRKCHCFCFKNTTTLETEQRILNEAAFTYQATNINDEVDISDCHVPYANIQDDNKEEPLGGFPL